MISRRYLEKFIIAGLCINYLASPVATEINKNGVVKCGRLRQTDIQSSIDKNYVKSCRNRDGLVWMVSIHKANENNTISDELCKGFLIHPQLVISTAKCVEGIPVSDLVVMTGAWIPRKIRDSTRIPIQQRKIANITNHPMYTPCNWRKNHAISLLTSSFDMSDPIVGVICVADSMPYDMSMCKTTSTIDVYNDTQCNDKNIDEPYSQKSVLEYDNLLCNQNNYYNNQISYVEEKMLFCYSFMRPYRFFYGGLKKRIHLRESNATYIIEDPFFDQVGWIRKFLHDNGITNLQYTISWE